MVFRLISSALSFGYVISIQTGPSVTNGLHRRRTRNKQTRPSGISTTSTRIWPGMPLGGTRRVGSRKTTRTKCPQAAKEEQNTQHTCIMTLSSTKRTVVVLVRYVAWSFAVVNFTTLVGIASRHFLMFDMLASVHIYRILKPLNPF